MNIALVKYENAWPLRHQYHVLTYAETRFSPLDMHTHERGLPCEVPVAKRHQESLRA